MIMIFLKSLKKIFYSVSDD